MKKSVIAWIFMFMVYSALSYSGVLHRLIYPQPHEMLLTAKYLFIPYLQGKSILHHAGISLIKTIGSAAWGTGFGLSFGFAMAYSRGIRTTFTPILSFFRSVPVTNLTSVFMTTFGLGTPTHMSMTTFRSFLDNAHSGEEGIYTCPKEILEAAVLEGANSFEILKHITAPLSVPYILSVMPVNVSLSFVLINVAETLMGSTGLGTLIRDAHSRYDIPQMWWGIIVSGLLGYAMVKVFQLLRTIFVDWI